jgi:hypothetical protein
VKSLNVVVMIVCLLRCLLLHFLRDCYHLYFRSCFAVRLPGPLPLISMMVSLSFGLSIFWDAILPRGGHSMYKPSDTCVNGVILRGVLFWESYFFGTVLLYNSLIPFLALLSDDVGINLSYFD